MENNVVVLIIGHRHGHNVYVCQDEEIAAHELYEYVQEW